MLYKDVANDMVIQQLSQPKHFFFQVLSHQYFFREFSVFYFVLIPIIYIFRNLKRMNDW